MASSSRQLPGGKRKRTEDDPGSACGGQSEKKRQMKLTNFYDDGNKKADGASNKQEGLLGDDESGKSATSSNFSLSLLEYMKTAKKKMQSKGSQNGVTCSLMGSSGCGKSTVLKKIFIDGLYSDNAQKELPKDERQQYVVSLFTESEHSDALEEMPKDITVFPKGIDIHAINWGYRTNSRYDKKYNFVNISDDCIHIRYSKMVEKMFLTMRNTNITSVVSLQYPKLIPLSVRTSVYFSFCFLFNNEEGIEQVVRGWLAGYLPGGNMREKMDTYRTWCMRGDGHCFFLLDNLNHKCFAVNEDYMMKELNLQSFMDYQLRGPRYSGKQSKQSMENENPLMQALSDKTEEKEDQ